MYCPLIKVSFDVAARKELAGKNGCTQYEKGDVCLLGRNKTHRCEAEVRDE